MVGGAADAAVAAYSANAAQGKLITFGGDSCLGIAKPCKDFEIQISSNAISLIIDTQLT